MNLEELGDDLKHVSKESEKSAEPVCIVSKSLKPV